MSWTDSIQILKLTTVSLKYNLIISRLHTFFSLLIFYFSFTCWKQRCNNRWTICHRNYQCSNIMLHMHLVQFYFWLYYATSHILGFTNTRVWNVNAPHISIDHESYSDNLSICERKWQFPAISLLWLSEYLFYSQMYIQIQFLC